MVPNSRSRAGRDGPIRVRAVAVPAIALDGAAICPSAAWATAAAALTPHALATLALVARDIYPHDLIADLFYINAVTPWDRKAASDPALRDLLTDGVARLDAATGASHGTPYLQLPSQADRIALLRDIEHTRFFSALRADLVAALYGQPEARPRFACAGSPTLPQVQRFAPIDWLPSS